MKMVNRWTRLKEILYYKKRDNRRQPSSDTSTPADTSTPGDTSEDVFQPPPTNPPFINP